MRKLLAVFVALLGLWSQAAHAVYVTADPRWYGNGTSPSTSAGYTTEEEVCALWTAYTFIGFANQQGVKPNRTASCNGYVTASGNQTPQWYAPHFEACPLGFSWDATKQTCIKVVAACPEGQSAQPDGQCVTQCQAKLGTAMGAEGQEVTIPTTGQTAPSKACQDGCTYKPISKAGFWARKGTSYTFVADGADWRADGTECAAAPEGQPGSDIMPPQPLPEPPPKGFCQGTVNGATVTVPCDETGTTSGLPSSGNTAGQTESKTSTAPKANGDPPAGTTTTDTQTRCIGDKCTTTTTTKQGNADGTTTTTTKNETEDKGDFCAEHPGSPNCAADDGIDDSSEEDPDPSTWGGGCGSWSCSGDAIQCAIAREQHQRNCQVFDQTSPHALIGLDALDNGPEGGPDHPRRDPTVREWSSALDQTDLIGGSCPSDISVPVGGRSVVLPLSKICTPAQTLGPILIGLTALACLGIMFGGGRRSEG